MTVSRRSQEIRPFVVMDVVARAKELEAEGRDIVRLEIGDPDFPTPAVITQAAEAAMEAGGTHYTQSLGLPDLREALRDHYRTPLRRRRSTPRTSSSRKGRRPRCCCCSARCSTRATRSSCPTRATRRTRTT